MKLSIAVMISMFPAGAVRVWGKRMSGVGVLTTLEEHEIDSLLNAHVRSETELGRETQELHNVTRKIVDRIFLSSDTMNMPGWMNKATFLSAGECIEKNVEDDRFKELVRSIVKADYSWRVLNDAERAELITDSEGHFAGTLKMWRNALTGADASKKALELEKLQRMIDTVEHVLTPWKYETERKRCLKEEEEKHRKYSKMWADQLGRSCNGQAGRLGNTCALTPGKPPCPEGSQCGAMSESISRKKMLMLSFGLYGMIWGSLSLVLGVGTAMVVPGQFETALALTTFFTNHGHQCVCVPKVCSWSDALGACTSQAEHESNRHGGMMIEATPLAGFKCVEEKPNSKSCRLDPCHKDDYSSDEFSSVMSSFRLNLVGDFHGSVGVIKTSSFNCWELDGKKSYEIDFQTRLQVYAELAQRRSNQEHQAPLIDQQPRRL